MKLAALMSVGVSLGYTTSMKSRKDYQVDGVVQNYRQPMVTAIGIILGFVLGFAGKWASEETTGQVSTADDIVLTGLTIGVVLLLVALYRILNNCLPDEKGIGGYYQQLLGSLSQDSSLRDPTGAV